MARELVLICWKCRLEIGQDDGYLWAHTGEVNTVQQTFRSWEQQHTGPYGGISLTLGQVLEYPEPACGAPTTSAATPTATGCTTESPPNVSASEPTSWTGPPT